MSVESWFLIEKTLKKVADFIIYLEVVHLIIEVYFDCLLCSLAYRLQA